MNRILWTVALAAAFAGNVRAEAKGIALGGISAKLEPDQLVEQDEFKGFPRTIFRFEGRKAWVVEPKEPRADGAWVWCMEWPYAFVTAAGQVNALERGYRYVTYECGNGMSDEEIEGCRRLQAFLVKELGLQPKANLIGMSWGGFYSVRYASAAPENVRKVYLDNPLLNFDGFHSGPRGWKRGDCAWSDDPRLSVNRAEPIARAGIPILLMYGDADDVCPPHLNCLPFAERFVKAGGDLTVLRRPGAKHHPHGVTGENVNRIVDFFEGRGRIGAFAHYLLKKEQFDRIGEYDVDGVADDLRRMGADHFFLTLGQNTGYFCSPNATYERTLGVASNECCSARDLPGELYAKLGEISLGLYLPCQPPFGDARTAAAFALGEKVDKWGNRVITPEAARRWAKVIEEWSVRYGDRVKAWWFDGAYGKCQFTEETAALYAAAAKKGNPKALVAFNFDVGVRAYMPTEDFTAGELNELSDVVCEGPTLEGRRWHALTFMGEAWGAKGVRVSPEAWVKTVNAAAAKGGSVSIDLNVDKPSGRFDPAQIEVFSRIQRSASRR